MYNHKDKFEIVNWNGSDVTCKNKRAISTHCINFTGPFVNAAATNLLIEIAIKVTGDPLKEETFYYVDPC